MKNFIKAMDNLPFIAKLILSIPALDIIWNIYRLCRSLKKGNLLGIILSVLLITVGLAFMWLIDIICVLLNNKVWWID